MIVLDATVVVKLVTREPGAEQALQRVLREDERIAPDWMRLEVASALSKKVLHDRLDAAVVSEALAAIDAFVTEWTSGLYLLEDALELSLGLRHAVYDCLYLALARRQNCLLVTHDAKFADSVKSSPYAASVELLA